MAEEIKWKKFMTDRFLKKDKSSKSMNNQSQNIWYNFLLSQLLGENEPP